MMPAPKASSAFEREILEGTASHQGELKIDETGKKP